MSKPPWEPVWNGRDWKVSFYVGRKRVRKGLKIRSATRRSLARKYAEEIYIRNVIADRETNEANNSLRFSTACYDYMVESGNFRFLEKCLKIVGPSARIDLMTDKLLWDLARKHHRPQLDASLLRSFVRPCQTVIRHARGEWKKPASVAHRVQRVMTVEEVLMFLAAAGSDAVVGRWDPDLQTLRKCAFMLGSGAGPGETCAVRVEDVDPTHQRVFISGKSPGASKNPYRRRWVYLPDFYWKMILPLPEAGRAFRTPRGQAHALRKYRGGQFRGAFATIRDAAGLSKDYTPYDLRHAWASHFYAATQNTKALTALGGWRDGEVPFSTYVDFVPPSTKSELLAASIDYGQVLDNLTWEHM